MAFLNGDVGLGFGLDSNMDLGKGWLFSFALGFSTGIGIPMASWSFLIRFVYMRFGFIHEFVYSLCVG